MLTCCVYVLWATHTSPPSVTAGAAALIPACTVRLAVAQVRPSLASLPLVLTWMIGVGTFKVAPLDSYAPISTPALETRLLAPMSGQPATTTAVSPALTQGDVGCKWKSPIR